LPQSRYNQLRIALLEISMTQFSKTLARIAVMFAALVVATGCANTIRGLGADTANAVDATQSAASNVARAAQ
jgi:entericidin B